MKRRAGKGAGRGGREKRLEKRTGKGLKRRTGKGVADKDGKRD